MLVKEIIELAKDNELADKLIEHAEAMHMQNATQAAYHQGVADAYRQIHALLMGNVKFEGANGGASNG